MSRLEKLRSKWGRRRKGRARQIRLWKKTGKRGHRKQAAKHGLAMRYLRKLIGREESRQPKRPKIYTGIVSPAAVFGGLGTPAWVTGHYTAGPVDESDAHAIALCKQYDSYHRGLGWGGIAYHYCITRAGSIIGLRPVGDKGAHTALHNSNNVGVMMHGTTGDKPTQAQADALTWLLANAHTSAMPTAHRASRRLADLPIRGHKDWPDNSTSCPGEFHRVYLTRGASI